MRILLGIVVGAIILSIARPHLQRLFDSEHRRIVAGARSGSLTSGASGAETHFSPTENLEDIEVKYLRQARGSIDVAMFAFTDKRIADILKQLAVGHVQVRIYRDEGQFLEEEEKAARFRDLSTSILLRGSVNIRIRVKQGSERDAMHRTSWCLDHRFLRDGSANWSLAGETTQDNQIHFTTDPEQIAAFENSFEEMWSRTSNRIVH
jgi:phosphatidylserine/phosphatidylglycerophosphate/cardiolipin synthase-like enzyme